MPNNTRSIKIQKLRTAALDLRKKGLSYSAIGFQLNIESSTAYKYVTDAMDQLRKDSYETAQDVLDIELMRLDDITKTVYNDAMGLDDDGNETGVYDLNAQKRLLEVHDRRSKLLNLESVAASKAKDESVFDSIDDIDTIPSEELGNIFDDIYNS